jgi:hypothetical protein
MLRALAFLLARLSLSAPASSETAPKPVDAQSTSILATPHNANRLLQSLGVQSSQQSTPPAQSCCKVCTVGKACGNT